MALKRTVKIGDEIDGRCTKCKEVTTHTVIAMVEDEIKKVQCLTCDGVHKYYPPRKKTAAKKTTVKKTAAKKATTKKTAVKKTTAKKTAAKKATAKKTAAKKTGQKATKSKTTQKKTTTKRRTQTLLTEWRNTVEEVGDDQFKPYIISGVFQEKDLIIHPTFGKGFVLKIMEIGKMEVLFEDSARRLIFQRSTDETPG